MSSGNVTSRTKCKRKGTKTFIMAVAAVLLMVAAAFVMIPASEPADEGSEVPVCEYMTDSMGNKVLTITPVVAQTNTYSGTSPPIFVKVNSSENIGYDVDNQGNGQIIAISGTEDKVEVHLKFEQISPTASGPSASKPVSVGTYKVCVDTDATKVTDKDDINVTSSYSINCAGPVSFEITKKSDIEVSLVQSVFEYGGEHTVQFKITGLCSKTDEANITPKLSSDVIPELKATEPGTYKIMVVGLKGTGSENYGLRETYFSLEWNIKSLGAVDPPAAKDLEKPYNAGNPVSVTKPAHTTVTGGSLTESTIGPHDFTLKLDPGYEWSDGFKSPERPFTWYILPNENSVTGTGKVDLIYGNTLQLELKPTFGGKLTYSGYDSTIISVNETGLITALKHGSTSITVKSETVDDHGSASKPVVVVVAPRDVSVNWKPGISTAIQYDGGQHSVSVDATGLLGTDGVDFTPKVSNNETNVGNYSFTVSLTGDTAGNYNLAGTTKFDWSIVAKPVTVSFDGLSSFEYDEHTTRTVSLKVNGLIGIADEQNVKPVYNGTLSGKVAQDYVVEITGLQGAGHENYIISEGQQPLTWTIGAIVVKPVLVGYDGPIVYDEKPHTVVVKIAGDGGVMEQFTPAFVDESECTKTNVGKYTIHLSGFTGTESSNYKMKVTEISWEIVEKEIDLSVLQWDQTAGYSVEYDGTVHTVQLKDVPQGLRVTKYDQNSEKDFGTYTASANILAKKGYKVVNAAPTFTWSITKKTLNIAIEDSLNETYDGKEHKISTSTAPCSGDELNLVLLYNGSIALPVNAGSYSVTISSDTKIIGAASVNYVVQTSDSATLKILPRDLTITANDKTITYGDEKPVFGTSDYTANYVEGEKESNKVTVVFDVPDYVKGNDATTYTITVSGNPVNNYNVTYVPGILTVGQKSLTITVNDATATYGDAPPSFTNYDFGYIDGEAHKFSVTYETVYKPGDAVGEYVVTPKITPGDNTNYNVTLVPAKLKVGQKTIVPSYTVAERYYDGTKVAKITVNNPGELYLDDELTVTATGIYEKADAGTDILLTIDFSIGSNIVSKNYKIEQVQVLEEIKAVPLTFTSEGATQPYNGSPLVKHAASLTGGAFVVGEGFTDFSFTGTVTDASTVKNTFTVNLKPGTTATNYAITYVCGDLTVTPAEVTLTTGDLSKVYDGTPLNCSGPATLTLVNNEKVDLVYSKSITKVSETGANNECTITWGEVKQANYNITENFGTMTITKAAPVLVWKSGSAPDFTYSGEARGIADLLKVDNIYTSADTVGYSLKENVSETDHSDSGYKVGFELVANSGDLNNYDVSALNELSWNIKQKPVTVTMSGNASLTYDNTAKTVALNIDGLVTKDQGHFTVNHTGSELTNTDAATYSVSGFALAGESAAYKPGNYSISNAGATLSWTISPQTVTVTIADKLSEVYTGARHDVAPEHVALAGGETLEFTVVYKKAGVIADPINAGTYEVSITGYSMSSDLKKSNYSITHTDTAQVVIAKKALTLTAEDKSAVYGDARPSFTFKISGHVPGEDAVLNGKVAFACIYEQWSDAKVYDIIPSVTGGEPDNYTVTPVNGTLTVSAKQITVNAKAVTYDFDGSEHTGAIEYETLHGTYEITANYSTVLRNAGWVTFTISDLKVEGGTAGNYEPVMGTSEAKLTVNPKTVEAEFAESYAYEYDGTEKIVQVKLKGGSVISPDDVGISITGGDRFSDAKSEHTVTFELNGAQKGNYKLKTGSLVWSIAKKTLTVSLSGELSQVYKAADCSVTLDLTGKVRSDDVGAVYDAALLTKKHAGTYEFTVSELKGTDMGNYRIAPTTLSWSITKAPFTVQLNDIQFDYDGAVQNLPVSGSLLGTDSITVALKYNNGPAPKDAGVYTVSIDEANCTISELVKQDYTLTLTDTATMTVNQVVLSVTPTHAELKYGDPVPADFGITEPSGYVGGDSGLLSASDLTFSTAYKQWNDANMDYDITATCDKVLKNYNVSIGTGKMHVAPKPVTVDAVDATYTFDGSQHEGKISYGTLNAGYAISVTFSEQYRDAGTHGYTISSPVVKTVTGNAGNYEPTIGTASANVIIDAKHVDAQFVGGTPNLTYNAAAQTVQVELKGGQVCGEDAVSIRIVSGDTQTNAHVGYKVVFELDGAQKDNYVLNATELSWDIKQKAVTVKIKESGFEYTGEIYEVTVVVVGLLSDGNSVIADTRLDSELFASASGVHDVYVTSISGTGYENYVLEGVPVHLTWGIGTTPVTIEWAKGPTFTYNPDGSCVAELTLVGLKAVDKSHVQIDTDPSSVSSAKNLGTYKIKVLGLSGDRKDNYTLDNSYIKEWEWTINPIEQDVSSLEWQTETSFAYSDSEHSVVLSGTVPVGLTAVYADNAKTDAGSYKATVSFTEAYGYKCIGSVLALNWEIKPQKVTITIEDLTSETYNGSGHPITPAHDVLIGSGVLNVVLEYTKAGVVSLDAPVNAGDYTVRIHESTSVSGTSKNYELVTVDTAAVHIGKMKLTVTADNKNIVFEDAIPTYTWSHSSYASGDTDLLASGDVTFDCAYIQYADAKTYSVVPKCDVVLDNYNIELKNGTLTVSPKAITVSAVPVINKDYTGEKFTGSFTKSDVMHAGYDVTVSYAYDKDQADAGTVTYTISAPAVTGPTPGNYSVTVKTGDSQGKIVIAPKKIDAAWDGGTAPDLKYSGADQTVTVVVDPGQYVVGDVVEVNLSGNVQKNAGTGYSVKVTLAGTDAGNYELNNDTFSWSIAKRSVTLTSQSHVFEFNGTDQKWEHVDVTGDGFALAEGATYSNFAVQKDAGSKDNTFDYTLVNGALAGNYTISKAYGTITVNAMSGQIIVTADSETWVYDGAEHSLDTYTKVGATLVAGDKLTVVIDGSITDMGTAVNKVVSVKVMRGSEDVSSSYDIGTPVNGNLAVTAKPVNSEWDGVPAGFVYSGDQFSVKVKVPGLIGTDGTSFETVGTTAYTDAKDGLKFTVQLTGNEKGNYDLKNASAEYVWNIAKKPLSVTTQSAERVYNGEYLTKPGCVLDGLVASEASVAGTATGKQMDFGTSDNTYSIDWKGFDKNNYEITEHIGTLSVTKKVINVTITDRSGQYTGTVWETSATHDPLVKEEQIEIVLSYADGRKDVGDYRVTIASVHMTAPAKDANYTFVNDPEGWIKISPRQLTVTTESGTQPYDGGAFVKNEGTIGGIQNGEDITLSFTGTITGYTEGGVPNTADVVFGAGAKSTNYEIKTENVHYGTLTVTKIELGLQWASGVDTSPVYKGEPYLFTKNDVKVTGLTGNDGVGFELTGVRKATDWKDGVYSIGMRLVGTESNYVNYVVPAGTPLDWTIEKKLITVQWEADNVFVYDGNLHSVKPVLIGLIGAEQDTVLPVYDESRCSSLNAASFDFTFTELTGEGSTNYCIASTDLSWKVQPKPVTITVDDLSEPYTGKTHDMAVHYSLIAGDRLTVVLTYSGSLDAPVDSGSYLVRIDGTTEITTGLPSNYVLDKADTANLEIRKLPLTITADSHSTVYGEPVPALTWKAAGYVNNEKDLVIPEISVLPYVQGGHAGQYPISVTGAGEIDNYLVTYVDGSMDVAKRLLKVDMTVSGKLYDGNDVANVRLNSFGNVYGDDEVDLVVSSARFDSKDAGLRNIVVDYYISDIINYDVDKKSFPAQIQKRDLHISSSDASKVYDGQPLTANSMKYIQGFAAGEGATFEYTGTITDAGTAVNGFTVNFNSGTLADNYVLFSTFGSLTVEKAPLVLKADDVTVVYGDDALFTYTADGYVTGEEGLVKPIFTSEYKAGNDVGEYRVSLGFTSVPDNYEIVIRDGKVTVTPRELEPIYEISDKQYDGTDSALYLVYSLRNMVSGDALSLSDTGRYNSCNVSDATEVTITVTLGGASAKNYTIAPVKVAAKILPCEITITSADAEKVFDNTALTAHDSVFSKAFPDGEGATLTFTGTQTDAGISDNTFSYVLNKGTDASNYSIDTVFGKLSVSKLPVTVTSVDAEQVYSGVPLQKHSASYAEGAFPSGQGITYAFTGTQTDAGVSDNVFTVVFNDGTKEANYEITTVFGKLSVSKLPITIVSSDAEKRYDGEPLTCEEYTLIGAFPAGQGATLTFTGTLTDMGSAENSFTYALNSGTDAANYEITTVFGKLEIKFAGFNEIEITSDISKVYDGTPVGKPLYKVPDGYTGTVEFTYLAGNKFVSEAPVHAGAYLVRMVAHADKVFPEAFVEAEFVISPMEITAEVSGSKILFDGKEHTVAAAPVGVLEGDTVAIVLSGEKTETEAGEYTAVMTLSGENAGDYVLAEDELVWRIAGKILEKGDFTMDLSDAVYCGKEIVRKVSSVFVQDRDYSVEYIDNVNAGTAVIRITGIGNYDGEQEYSFVITKAPLTVSAIDTGVMYGKVLPEIAYEISGLQGDDTEADLGFTVSFTAYGVGPVGTYRIVPAYEFVSPNYEVTAVGAELTVGEHVVVIEWPDMDFSYNGRAHDLKAIATDETGRRFAVPIEFVDSDGNAAELREKGEYTARAVLPQGYAIDSTVAGNLITAPAVIGEGSAPVIESDTVTLGAIAISIIALAILVPHYLLRKH